MVAPGVASSRSESNTSVEELGQAGFSSGGSDLGKLVKAARWIPFERTFDMIR